MKELLEDYLLVLAVSSFSCNLWDYSAATSAGMLRVL